MDINSSGLLFAGDGDSSWRRPRSESEKERAAGAVFWFNPSGSGDIRDRIIAPDARRKAAFVGDIKTIHINNTFGSSKLPIIRNSAREVEKI